jgi:Raf kinase inhibitor-like YbhB/YbcL family protein
MTLTMTSRAFEDGGIVPPRYSCFGDNVRPEFQIANPPPGTLTYALILHDIDVALGGSAEDGLHWLAWNIPAHVGGIAEDELPDGAVVGRNVEGRNAYLGPGAPPGPRYHHYVFELYALDAKLKLEPTAGRAELLAAMDGTVVGKAAYVGRFRRSPDMVHKKQ